MGAYWLAKQDQPYSKRVGHVDMDLEAITKFVISMTIVYLIIEFRLCAYIYIYACIYHISYIIYHISYMYVYVLHIYSVYTYAYIYKYIFMCVHMV